MKFSIKVLVLKQGLSIVLLNCLMLKISLSFYVLFASVKSYGINFGVDIANMIVISFHRLNSSLTNDIVFKCLIISHTLYFYAVFPFFCVFLESITNPSTFFNYFFQFLLYYKTEIKHYTSQQFKFVFKCFF